MLCICIICVIYGSINTGVNIIIIVIALNVMVIKHSHTYTLRLHKRRVQCCVVLCGLAWRGVARRVECRVSSVECRVSCRVRVVLPS